MVLMVYSLASTLTVAPYVMIGLIPMAAVYIGIMQFFRPSRTAENSVCRHIAVYAIFEKLCGGIDPRVWAVDPMEERNIEVLAVAQRAIYLQDSCNEWLTIRLQQLAVDWRHAAVLLWMYGHDTSRASILGFALSNPHHLDAREPDSGFTQCETSCGDGAAERLFGPRHCA